MHKSLVEKYLTDATYFVLEDVDSECLTDSNNEALSYLKFQDAVDAAKVSIASGEHEQIYVIDNEGNAIETVWAVSPMGTANILRQLHERAYSKRGEKRTQIVPIYSARHPDDINRRVRLKLLHEEFYYHDDTIFDVEYGHRINFLLADYRLPYATIMSSLVTVWQQNDTEILKHLISYSTWQYGGFSLVDNDYEYTGFFNSDGDGVRGVIIRSDFNANLQSALSFEYAMFDLSTYASQSNDRDLEKTKDIDAK